VILISDRYDFFNSDIFAANVIAKDPYTGRQVHLIDARGYDLIFLSLYQNNSKFDFKLFRCPVDLYVFPELHKTPDGALEAEFYAFKIPDSNFLVFQATVRTCRGPCEPVICSDRGRGPGYFPSWGRKKRSILNKVNETRPFPDSTKMALGLDSELNINQTEDEEEVHELLRVYLSRAEIPSPESLPLVLAEEPKVCITQANYYTLITAVTILFFILTLIMVSAFVIFKRSKIGVS